MKYQLNTTQYLKFKNMIVDNYCGNLCAFDGSNYQVLDKYENIFIGQNLETKSPIFEYLFGIIHFSSPYTYTIPNKKDCIRKTFTPAIHKFKQQIRVKTSKISQKKDLYAIIKIETIENNIILCDVVNYIGDIGNKESEDKFMEYICSANWKRTKKITQLFLDCKDIDLTPNREDYTKKIIYSIDPENCLDIDDALHCEYNIETNTYEIGIHIADVSSYIQENTLQDEELKNRIETIYNYKKSPIHMIPEELSVNYISLLEQRQKRAFSVIIKLQKEDNKITILDVKFKKTNIIVKKNLTYEEAQNMILLDDNVKNLFELGLLLKNEISSSFDTNIIYDTHQMVEVYMIYANKFAGEFIHTYDSQNILLRSHKTSKQQDIICDVQDEKIKLVLQQKHNVTKTEQARYQIGSHNSQHKGLNLDFYTHMTSPIRRYADIIIHRQLWNMMCNIKLQKPEIKTVFLMNYFKKIYKQTERFMKICELANIIGQTCVTTDAYITNINENMIRIYIEEYNIDYDVEIVNDKLKYLDIDKKYVLFQKIKVKLVCSREPFVKFYFEFFL